MFDINKKEIEWCGRKLTIETGRIGRQADSSVIVTYEGTTVMANVCSSKTVNPEIDFFPLTVNYQEKFYSIGKIPGSFFKREGRPTEKETLVSRLIDRPIRPLFNKDFKNETQVTCTVLSHDQENDSDIVSLIAASAAISFSGLPFMGPIGAAKIAMIDGKLIANPTIKELKNSTLDLIVAGTEKGVLMVESEAHQLSEDEMLKAVVLGQNSYKIVIDTIAELAKKSSKEPIEIPEIDDEIKELPSKIAKKYKNDLKKVYETKEKKKRVEDLQKIRNQISEEFLSDKLSSVVINDSIKYVERDIVRGELLKTGKRIDGRDTTTIRPINCEVGVLQRTHGSALFTRGETQALVVTTLGTGLDEQRIDAIEGEYKENFMLHYNFPPYSVGEVGRIGSTSRREVGHGKLAWRAIHPMMPKSEEFPYTFRVVSEITESNGSSSMATVCGTSLSLMDAGVPIAKPIAGIAMGLIKEEKNYVILSDILGDEDHLGDMDFKVAGTSDGITSLQMDIKITSITPKIMEEALSQAKKGRIHILGEMNKVIDKSREKISDFAPTIRTIKVHKDKIKDVIGKGGAVIREITETTGAKIEINDDGIVSIAAVDAKAGKAAIERINDIVAEPEIGKTYKGKVVKIMEFGAFVNFLGTTDGLVHISQIKEERVEKVTDVLKEGEEVKVKVLDIDKRGKIKLSIKDV
ncbi:MAG: Polyribonucleotide nucleotidyltransferase [Alphaproteobacteria bacterium MarineAlpha5_Bin11]|nr:polyribonucleotide nucleotidyltransferase [Pelagibacteraceae bacterium]PPR45154.1 MAG: Polyribonucleotide nucleotidyltransferase [Alphaproteobacteria bacterium MarineAlpha5_Bin11]PPR52126.1 MAG: Polyribonucleotide nucleotidyltransferase [Alphaproteobacteria bacterium MarineAlpha5_Bin10]|tara:strand:+ start:18373 stop:20448 length:2076 start_codon:yes stop_codon:yes gene_type:complete